MTMTYKVRRWRASIHAASGVICDAIEGRIQELFRRQRSLFRSAYCRLNSPHAPQAALTRESALLGRSVSTAVEV